MFELSIFIVIAFVVAVIFTEYESKKEKEMEKRKRPVKFTTRRWFAPNDRENRDCNENGWETTQREGMFHQWGNDIDFDGDPQQPLNVTIGICEDRDGNVFTVNPNDIQFQVKD